MMGMQNFLLNLLDFLIVAIFFCWIFVAPLAIYFWASSLKYQRGNYKESVFDTFMAYFTPVWLVITVPVTIGGLLYTLWIIPR